MRKCLKCGRDLDGEPVVILCLGCRFAWFIGPARIGGAPTLHYRYRGSDPWTTPEGCLAVFSWEEVLA